MKCLICKNNTSIVISDKLRHGEKKDVYYCEKCELGMLDDSANETDLKKFYQDGYRKRFKPNLIKGLQNPEELFNAYSKFQGGRVKLIKKHLKKNMCLLEIGCSAGMFLFHIKRYVHEIVGIDYDSRSADFAAHKCSCKTYDVAIEKTGIAEKRFDVICMFQVLEHVRDPHLFLKNIKRRLKPGGKVFIEIPNISDVLISAYSLSNHYNFYFHSAHRWYFSKKSLLLLMSKAGFTGKIYFTQDYNILNHMHWLSTDAPQPDCVGGLSEPRLQLREKLETFKKKALSKFIIKCDRDYKKLLSRLQLTSNISFIGQKQ